MVQSFFVPNASLEESMSTFKYLILIISVFFSGLSGTYAEALLKENNGNNRPFSALKGKWVLINYWASWCPSCLEEIPEFNRFYAEHKQDPVEVFAVNFDGLSLAAQNSLIKRFNIHYPSLMQDPSDALKLGDIRGIPVTFVFNPQGELVDTLYGSQTAKHLNKIIAKK